VSWLVRELTSPRVDWPQVDLSASCPVTGGYPCRWCHWLCGGLSSRLQTWRLDWRGPSLSHWWRLGTELDPVQILKVRHLVLVAENCPFILIYASSALQTKLLLCQIVYQIWWFPQVQYIDTLKILLDRLTLLAILWCSVLARLHQREREFIFHKQINSNNNW